MNIFDVLYKILQTPHEPYWRDAKRELSADAASELHHRGFVVLPAPAPYERMERLADAYTAAVSSAAESDLKIGSTTTRVSDFVNCGEAFDALYIFPPLLDACCRVIGRPFKLSSLQARTVRPLVPAQDLHVDVQRDSFDWPLLGFILMVDAFQPDNGATRFVPGSHHWRSTPAETMSDLRADYAGQTLACGDAGSLLVSTGRLGMATPPTQRAARGGRFKAPSFHGGTGWNRLRRPHVTRDAGPTGASRAVCARTVTTRNVLGQRAAPFDRRP